MALPARSDAAKAAAPPGGRLGGLVIACATAVVLLGASIAPFLLPAYVRLEQDRVGVTRLTGYDAAELDTITAALLADLVLWRGDFDVSVEGTPAAPVLTERERGHMRDVRTVFAGLFALVALSLVTLAVAARRTSGTEARFATWRAVRGGALGLAIGVAVAGTFAVLAFDAAFELFHRLFFSAGSYTFDPATDRLVQLFPMQFWSETAIAIGTVVLVAAILTSWLAGRRASGPTPNPQLAPSSRAAARGT